MLMSELRLRIWVAKLGWIFSAFLRLSGKRQEKPKGAEAFLCKQSLCIA